MPKKNAVAKSFETKNNVAINIGISEKNAQEVANILQVILSDEQVLCAKTRNYHWNVEGSDFLEYHKLFETLYDELAESIDEIAERIRTIGHFALGRLEDFLKLARLLEGEYTSDPKRQLQNLLDDYETIIRELRKDIEDVDDKYKDAGTADLLTGLMKNHERQAWFLRSYLGGKK